jgi:hypothetical protein
LFVAPSLQRGNPFPGGRDLAASALGIPWITPASTNARRFNRNKVAWQVPLSAATAVTDSPDRRPHGQLYSRDF